VTWGAPGFLWALPVVLLLVGLLLWTGFRWRRRLARQIDPALWDRLTGGGDRALARDPAARRPHLQPAGGRASAVRLSRVVQVKRSGVDVLVALDASAAWMPPMSCRVAARSRREIADLVERLRGIVSASWSSRGGVLLCR
jgi:hypothetical protein